MILGKIYRIIRSRIDCLAEINPKSDRLLVTGCSERLPSIDVAHADLAGSQQRPRIAQ